MLRFLVFLVGFLTPASLALALDMPARTPGLWEIKFAADLPAQDPPTQRRETARRCIDATVDQLFWRRDLGEEPATRNLCRWDASSSNGTITADVVCTFGGRRETSHIVIRGDFKRAYTMDTTWPNGDHVTIAYKHTGPCEADQRPGDFITSDGTTLHLFGDPK